jgi:hypothetical protein
MRSAILTRGDVGRAAAAIGSGLWEPSFQAGASLAESLQPLATE